MDTRVTEDSNHHIPLTTADGCDAGPSFFFVLKHGQTPHPRTHSISHTKVAC